MGADRGVDLLSHLRIDHLQLLMKIIYEAEKNDDNHSAFEKRAAKKSTTHKM